MSRSRFLRRWFEVKRNDPPNCSFIVHENVKFLLCCVAFCPCSGGYQGNELIFRNEQCTFLKIRSEQTNWRMQRWFRWLDTDTRWWWLCNVCNSKCLITCLLQGYNIISVLSLEIVPIMELLASMKTHSVPEDVDVSSVHTQTHILFFLDCTLVSNWSYPLYKRPFEFPRV